MRQQIENGRKLQESFDQDKSRPRPITKLQQGDFALFLGRLNKPDIFSYFVSFDCVTSFSSLNRTDMILSSSKDVGKKKDYFPKC